MHQYRQWTYVCFCLNKILEFEPSPAFFAWFNLWWRWNSFLCHLLPIKHPLKSFRVSWRYFLYNLEWATLVTHHFFRAHICGREMLESTILYDILLIGNLSLWWNKVKKEAILTNSHATWTSVCSIGVLRKALSMVIVVTVNTKNNYFNPVKPFFRSLNLVTPLLLEEMLDWNHIDVS